MTEAPNLPPLRVIHQGFVTRDLGAGLDFAAKISGRPHGDPKRFHHKVDTPKGQVEIKVAAFDIGGQNIELIEPVGGADDFYRVALPAEDGLITYHHIGARIDSLEEWDALMAEAERCKIQFMVLGQMGKVKYCYLDLRPWIGTIVEYLYYGPKRTAEPA